MMNTDGFALIKLDKSVDNLFFKEKVKALYSKDGIDYYEYYSESETIKRIQRTGGSDLIYPTLNEYKEFKDHTLCVKPLGFINSRDITHIFLELPVGVHTRKISELFRNEDLLIRSKAKVKYSESTITITAVADSDKIIVNISKANSPNNTMEAF